jgi:NDP-hexose 4-ketoreductase
LSNFTIISYQKLNMPKILVFGAAGFLGRHVQTELMQQGFEVFGFGHRDTGLHQALDLTNLEAVQNALEEHQPSAIINCAGRTLGTRFELVRDNILVVTNLLEAISQKAPNARLVHIGSAAEYGMPQDQNALTEEAPTRPDGQYGITKLAASALVIQASLTNQIDGVVLRLSNPLGAGMNEGTLPGRAAKLFKTALETSDTTITLGPLEAFRDFIDARDVAKAALLAATAAKPEHKLFNLGSGNATQARVLIQTLAKIAGFTGEILERDLGSARSAGVSWQQADISRIKNWLAWQPQFKIEESLTQLWNAANT